MMAGRTCREWSRSGEEEGELFDTGRNKVIGGCKCRRCVYAWNHIKYMIYPFFFSFLFPFFPPIIFLSNEQQPQSTIEKKVLTYSRLSQRSLWSGQTACAGSKVAAHGASPTGRIALWCERSHSLPGRQRGRDACQWCLFRPRRHILPKSGSVTCLAGSGAALIGPESACGGATN